MSISKLDLLLAAVAKVMSQEKYLEEERKEKAPPQSSAPRPQDQRLPVPSQQMPTPN